MKIVAYGDIMERGRSVFTSVTTIDDSRLTIRFSGVIRVDTPYRHLENYVADLGSALADEKIAEIEFDFRELSFCNSNGFYVIMDITEMVVSRFASPIFVKRLRHDDWHQETLPILLNADEPSIARRLTIEDCEEE